MNIGPNTPVNDLCDALRLFAATLRIVPSDIALLMETADRLELLAIDNEDLRNQNHNNRVAAEARWDRIKWLEEAGDRMLELYEEIGTDSYDKDAMSLWRKAKEAKP